MLTADELPVPRHELGYPWSQINEILNLQELAALRLWMEGQTMALDERTGEGIIYGHDLKRFLSSRARWAR